MLNLATVFKNDETTKNCNRNFLGLSGCFRALPKGPEKLRMRQTGHEGRLGTCILVNSDSIIN